MHLERHFADFIEKERAVVALLETSDPLAMRPGEGPLFVTEKLAFEQILRNRRAVDRQKALVAPRAVVVDGSATSSFPEPLSPVIITGASLAATRPIILKTCCMASDLPTMSS